MAEWHPCKFTIMMMVINNIHIPIPLHIVISEVLVAWLGHVNAVCIN